MATLTRIRAGLGLGVVLELTASFNRPKDVGNPLFHPNLEKSFASPSEALAFLAAVMSGRSFDRSHL
jgi:hypothetical protein